MDRWHDHQHHEGDPDGSDHLPKGARDDFDESGRTADSTPEGQGDIVPEIGDKSAAESTEQ